MRDAYSPQPAARSLQRLFFWHSLYLHRIASRSSLRSPSRYTRGWGGSGGRIVHGLYLCLNRKPKKIEKLMKATAPTRARIPHVLWR